MPKNRPVASGYARLAQADEEEDEYLDDSDRDDPSRSYPTLSAPSGRQNNRSQPERRTDRMQPSSRPSLFQRRRVRRNSGVDLKALNARLERWADEIASRFKLKKGPGKHDTEHLEIQHSVFQAPEGLRPATEETLNTEFADPLGVRMSVQEFEDIVESVRVAIEMDVHPTLISKGSSGSYFARNSEGTIVGVFKPKDEEPYATRNPKWTKWIHRNLFPCFFGRACLIPNLSYVSEAAAYVLDAQLRCNLVPYTDVVGFSSKSFHYDYWDRRAFYRKKKPLPEKLGSFQVFLKGYKDATNFFKEHPWPDQSTTGLNEIPRKKKRRWADDCGRGSTIDDDEVAPLTAEESDRRRVFWTDNLQLKFRQQLEKLVILDYIMRNTDRGLDNWMIRVDEEKQDAEIVIEPQNGHLPTISTDEPYMRAPEHMVATSRTGTPMQAEQDNTSISIGAIDNSLSWPWKHPDAVRLPLPCKFLIHFLTITVAQLSFWLALSPRFTHWSTILRRYSPTLSTLTYFQSMVG
jgi:phosphatidylinositol 4-kinase type 2